MTGWIAWMLLLGVGPMVWERSTWLGAMFSILIGLWMAERNIAEIEKRLARRRVR